MKLYFKHLIYLAVVCVAMSCSNDDTIVPTPSDGPAVAEGTAELRLAVPDTRATLDEDYNLLWRRGDRITIAAYSDDALLFAKESRFWASLTDNSTDGYTQAYFRTVFDTTAEADVLTSLGAMSNGRCYAISPVKGVTLSGTTATMTIPSTQSGEYRSAPDFMTARSSAISQLKVCEGADDNDYINNIDLTFTHHTHAFKVRIPANNLGQEVVRAYVKFPFAVVGDMTVDYTTGSVTASNLTSDLVVVEFEQAKSAGDEFWVMIAPQDKCSTVDIRFQAADGTYTERRIATFSQQNWSAGKISKISMSVPVATTLTYLDAKVSDYSQLGEPVTNLHMNIPAGYYYADYSSQYNATANTEGVFSFPLFSDMVDSTLRNANLTLSFESENAIVPTAVVLGDSVNVGEHTDYDLVAPYLMFQDFSGLTASFTNGESNAGASSPDAIDLASYGLSGWAGYRSSGKVGLSLRACVRYESGIGFKATYKGRLTAAALSYLKPGATVKLKVVFDAGAYENSTIGSASNVTYTTFGTTTTTGSELFGSDALDWSTDITITAGFGSDDYGSASLPEVTTTVPSASSATRLSWIIQTSRSGSFAGQGNYYMYLDDLRVSIAQ